MLRDAVSEITEFVRNVIIPAVPGHQCRDFRSSVKRLGERLKIFLESPVFKCVKSQNRAIHYIRDCRAEAHNRTSRRIPACQRYLPQAIHSLCSEEFMVSQHLQIQALFPRAKISSRLRLPVGDPETLARKNT